jgi:ribose-phosphate pyrophosphokinase
MARAPSTIAATMPTLFSFPEHSPVAKYLCDLPALKPGQFSIVRYQNQELHASIQSAVSGEHCLVLGSITPPEHQLASLSLLAHTLRKEGADRITGVLPYLAYSREDKLKPGESLATAWVGALLKASGFDEVWVVDLHSEHDRELFPLPLHSLSPATLFGECLRRFELSDASFVAPDEGAMARCEAVKAAAGETSGEIVHFQKLRTAAGIVHHDPIGRVGRRAVIVDDVLDTGATLVSACERLLAAGAAELHICVTHGIFAGQRWQGLWSLPVKHIFCTDTIPACARNEDSRITVLPVGPLLRAKIAAIL